MTAIQTIEEFLQVKDWEFSLELKRGEFGNFHWLRSEDLPIFDLFDTLDLFDIIDLPSIPFQVIVTRYGYDGGARNYGAWDGWRHIGECAIIGPVSTMPQLEYDLGCAQIVIDGSHSDAQIANVLQNFKEPKSLTDMTNAHADYFWKAFELLNPYCYYSNWEVGALTLILRDKEQLDQFVGAVDEAETKRLYIEEEQKKRRSFWESFGAELGPEKCIEEGCDRLRIQLSIRCFIHHLFDRKYLPKLRED